MKKILITILIIFISISTYSSDETPGILKGIKSGKDFSLFMQYYYLHPRHDLIVQAIEFVKKKKLTSIKSNQNHFVPFFGEIFKANDNKVHGWFKNIKNLSDTDIYIFSQALFWGNGKKAKEQIFILLKKTKDKNLVLAMTQMAKNSKQLNLKTDRIHSTGQLDMLWNSFFATGDEDYVKRIIALTEEKMDNMNSIGIYSSARWSLQNVAHSHKKVYDICESESKKQNKNVSLFLKKILKK